MADPRDEEAETPESIAATRKVMALISISLVLVIDVSAYTFARQKPGVFAAVAIPMAVVTLAVFAFAWRMLVLATRRPDSEDVPHPSASLGSAGAAADEDLSGGKEGV